MNSGKLFWIELAFHASNCFPKQVGLFANVKPYILSFGFDPVDLLGLYEKGSTTSLNHQAFGMTRPGLKFFQKRQCLLVQLAAALTGQARLCTLKSFFDTPPQIASLAGQVRSGGLRRFVLEQTILGSLVDGSWSARDAAFIRSLAENLGVSTEELGGIEIEMAEFFASHRSILDVFRVSAGAGAKGEELVQSMQQTLEKNFHRLMREVRGTGELSVLLTRVARGQKLSAEERRKMRVQLIDVAKAIPALAIFAAPGGILLFIALAKVLPFNILPSAFQDEPDEDLVPRSTRRADA